MVIFALSKIKMERRQEVLRVAGLIMLELGD